MERLTEIGDSFTAKKAILQDETHKLNTQFVKQSIKKRYKLNQIKKRSLLLLAPKGIIRIVSSISFAKPLVTIISDLFVSAIANIFNPW